MPTEETCLNNVLTIKSCNIQAYNTQIQDPTLLYIAVSIMLITKFECASGLVSITLQYTLTAYIAS